MIRRRSTYAAQKIQRCYRGHLARVVLAIVLRERKRKRQENAVIAVQRIIRGYLARARVNRKKASWILQNRNVAAVSIQSLYKGYSTRRISSYGTQPNIIQSSLTRPLDNEDSSTKLPSLLPNRIERRHSDHSSAPQPAVERIVMPRLIRRRTRTGREELRLNEPELGDNF